MHAPAAVDDRLCDRVQRVLVRGHRVLSRQLRLDGCETRVRRNGERGSEGGGMVSVERLPGRGDPLTLLGVDHRYHATWGGEP